MTGDLANNWDNFRAKLEDYLLAPALDEKSEAVQAVILRQVIGCELSLPGVVHFELDNAAAPVKASLSNTPVVLRSAGKAKLGIGCLKLFVASEVYQRKQHKLLSGSVALNP